MTALRSREEVKVGDELPPLAVTPTNVSIFLSAWLSGRRTACTTTRNGRARKATTTSWSPGRS